MFHHFYALNVSVFIFIRPILTLISTCAWWSNFKPLLISDWDYSITRSERIAGLNVNQSPFDFNWTIRGREHLSLISDAALINRPNLRSQFNANPYKLFLITEQISHGGWIDLIWLEFISAYCCSPPLYCRLARLYSRTLERIRGLSLFLNSFSGDKKSIIRV